MPDLVKNLFKISKSSGSVILMLDLLPLILDVFRFEYSIANDSSGHLILSSMHCFKDNLRSLNFDI